MSKIKIIGLNDAIAVEFHRSSSATSPLVEQCPRIPVDELVETTGNTADAWAEIRYQINAFAAPLIGWIEARFLGDAVADPTQALPVDEMEFVAECVRFEASSQEDRTIGADYLLAWAWLETGLSDFAPHLHDVDAIGPYQISAREWAEYLAANVIPDPDPDGRLSGYAQIDCAAWIGKRDVEDFIKEIATEHYVPSLLNVFHCRLIGVKAAVQVQKIQSAKTANPTMDAVLSPLYDAQALTNLLADRKRYLGKNPVGDFSAVDAFVNVTSAALTDAMKKAFSLLKKHVPDFIPAIDDKKVSAGWMAAAERELKTWTDGNLIESKDEGRERVKEYFTAASNPHSPDEAWCGAFAAWCLKQAGEAATLTIVDDPEWAANWKNWGDLELRQRDWSGIPFGAVVVMAPAENTDSSGHVAFFRQTVPSGKIELLGGNQSDRVKTMVVERNKVVSIRWLSALDVAPDSTDTAPIEGADFRASLRDRIILARTLYGEARGEDPQGKRAVAAVVINRAKSKRWEGRSIEAICLQRLQFSCWNANDPNRNIIKNKQPGKGDGIFDQCYAIAEQAVLGQLLDETDGATHFHADTIRRFPSWADPQKRTAHIGHHIFYRDV
ncbi:hypothetical protein ILFOPFJJ_04827 [Ensifer psoraleae]|uniref:cell wall hydrolase n=1 Tax=Sinorhizobium psoraleae TaxID=520838 RepID=UPI001568C506|nr:cell wall hydrolase [Sinorhizobium psoraleae]NRP73909.1 hypothetical protein [Sinorhizobium psoraleae]